MVSAALGEKRAAANAAYDAENHGECARLFVETAAASRGRERGDDLELAACCDALGGKIDDALAHLAQAIDAHVSYLDDGKRDPDLAALRADPRWPALAARYQARFDAYAGGLHAEIKRLRDEDQADRAKPYDAIDWKVVGPRDATRRARIEELLAAGAAKAPEDFLNAALVLQHGETATSFARAHELAMRAVALDATYVQARWLAAAAKDRELLALGKPQLYGTQSKKVDGAWIVPPVDPTVTDEERAKWHVQPIQAQRAAVAKKNAAR